MKQQSPQAKICMACRHLNLAVSARGSQISLGICALGYGMLRHHLKVHTCTSVLLQGCLPLWKMSSWPGYSSWGQTAASWPPPSRQTFTSCFGSWKWDAEIGGLLATLFTWPGLLSVWNPLFFFHARVVALKPGAIMKHLLGVVYSYTSSAVIHNARVQLTRSTTISCDSKALRQNTQGWGGEMRFPLNSLSSRHTRRALHYMPRKHKKVSSQSLSGHMDLRWDCTWEPTPPGWRPAGQTGMRGEQASQASRTKPGAWYSRSWWTPEYWDFPGLRQCLYNLPCQGSLPYISGLSNNLAAFGGLIFLIGIAFITQQWCPSQFL